MGVATLEKQILKERPFNSNLSKLLSNVKIGYDSVKPNDLCIGVCTGYNSRLQTHKSPVVLVLNAHGGSELKYTNNKEHLSLPKFYCPSCETGREYLLEDGGTVAGTE